MFAERFVTVTEGGKNVNAITTGSEIAPSWAPMRLKIQSWQPEFHSWSPASDL